jgi:hypothetical protein
VNPRNTARDEQGAAHHDFPQTLRFSFGSPRIVDELRIGPTWRSVVPLLDEPSH